MRAVVKDAQRSRLLIQENVPARLRLLGPAQSGSALAHVENDESRLKENITDDGEADAGVRLQATEAGGSGNRAKVEVAAGSYARVSQDLTL